MLETTCSICNNHISITTYQYVNFDEHFCEDCMPDMNIFTTEEGCSHNKNKLETSLKDILGIVGVLQKACKDGTEKEKIEAKQLWVSLREGIF